MPFEIPNYSICRTCPHGYCVSYIREKSKTMKDRDTLFRIAQNAVMACAFEDWVPSSSADPRMQTPLDSFVIHAIGNATNAGGFLEAAEHFGPTEKTFNLTPAQIGKVRGDVLEMLCRAVLWNFAAYTVRNALKLPQNELEHFGSYVPGKDFPPLAVISLGDNYKLEKLFTKDAADLLKDFQKALKTQGAMLAYSTPDTITLNISGLDHDTLMYFAQPITNLGIESQQRMRKAVLFLQGKVSPQDILFAGAIKTSIRSDRLYQFLFEANAWKYIWRRIFKLKPSRFYSVTMRVYGAEMKKLTGVDFTSTESDPNKAVKAIDEIYKPETGEDLALWFSTAVTDNL